MRISFCSFMSYLVMTSYLHVCLERNWVLIASVPDLCILFTFVTLV